MLAPGWQEEIDEAQTAKRITLRGERFYRTAHGTEKQLDYCGQRNLPCRDCTCDIGQLHVPSCCCEQCPKCHAQLLSCLCRDDPIDPWDGIEGAG